MTPYSVLFLAKPNIPQRIRSISRFAGEHGWILRVESTALPPKDWNGDGILTTPDPSVNAILFLKRQLKRKIPVVGLNEDCSRIRFPRVSGDDHEIGRLAAAHFNARNFRHAVFFSVHDDPNSHPARLAGFLDAWKGHVPQVWLWANEASEQRRENWHELHAWLVNRLTNAPKPLAVFAWNDADSVHVLNACRRAGLAVPNDVAILGVDNDTALCEGQAIQLSSVAHDLGRIGHVGAAMLERLMSGGKLARQMTRVKPKGVVTRESTRTLAVDDERFSPVSRYIDEHLSRAFGAAEIAAALNLSRRALDRWFRATFNRSVGDEIAARRILKAKELLKEGLLSVEEIAARCGYCNRQFFSRKFRAATGLTPLAWRKRR